MLQKDTLLFLKNIKIHNEKSWLDANRKSYESAKEDFNNLVADFIKGIAQFDPAIASLLPRDCTFRLNRDIRFSKDKSPYKTNFGASFNAGGKKMPTAGYYIHVEPGKSFAGGGLWMPAAPELAKIRQEIDYNLEDWNRIINGKAFKKSFPNGLDQEDRLVRPPKGYEETNPAIEYLKLKSFTIGRAIPDEELLSRSLEKSVLNTFKQLHPMLQFLNHAIQ